MNRAWRVLGWGVAAFAVVTGLAVVGMAVLLVVSVNSWGSNK